MGRGFALSICGIGIGVLGLRFWQCWCNGARIGVEEFWIGMKLVLLLGVTRAPKPNKGKRVPLSSRPQR